jgi:hypothetical protein
MWPALNLAGHWTSLSGPARARKPLLPVGVTSLTNCRRGGLGVLSQKCLRSSITFWRSSRSQPYSRTLRFCVMRRRASFPAKRRLRLNEDATSLQARLARSLWPPDGSLRGTPVNFSATTRFAASAPCCAKRAKGRAVGCHPLNGLHDSLHTYNIKIRIQVLNQSCTRSSGV